MALHDVTAEAGLHHEWAFEIDTVAGVKIAEVGAVEGFLGEVG